MSTNQLTLFELQKFYGVDNLEAAIDLLHATVHSNARSHIRGVASECRFKASILQLKNVIKIEKVPDNDYTKRYDFDVTFQVNDTTKIVSFEVKTANAKGSFDLNFRDGRERNHCGKLVRSHLRSIDESFDFAAVNMVNVTGSWDDISIIPFHALPILSSLKSKTLLKEIQEEMIASKKYIAGTIHLNKVESYSINDLPLLLKC